MTLISSFSKEEIDYLLEEAEVRLDFGDTVMGIFINFRGAKVVVGRRYFDGMDQEFFKTYGIFGPYEISPDQIHFAALNIEHNATKLKQDGLFHKVDAIMAVSTGIYHFLRDELIVDNKLTNISDGVWEGKLNVNGVIYRLLALNGDVIPGHQFTFFFVDKNRQIVY